MVYCNKCKHNFEPKIRTRYIEEDVEEIFFNCPKCHERYIAYYLNDKIKELQIKLRSKGSRVNGKDFLRKQIEEEMNRLEELYSTH